MANDLLLGSNRFVSFVRQFDKKNELIDEPWIEGCVYIDLDTNHLLFWEIAHLSEFSVRQEYLKLLKEIWKGWKISLAEKEMYDIEKLIEIDYTSKQRPNFDRIDMKEFANKTIGEYTSCLIIMKNDNNLRMKELYDCTDEEVALLGEGIIDILDRKSSSQLLKESQIESPNLLLIDIDEKKLFVNQSITGLEDELIKFWPGWHIEVGNFGYINILQKVSYDVSKIKMSVNEVAERMRQILAQEDDFNPNEMAQGMIKLNEEVKFHPHFFENIKPQKSIWERIKSFFSRK
ncbi:MAG: hypothetical protein AAGI38_12860 [Bacteroidota bacterium]